MRKQLKRTSAYGKILANALKVKPKYSGMLERFYPGFLESTILIPLGAQTGTTFVSKRRAIASWLPLD